jgi:hypothetical protein
MTEEVSKELASCPLCQAAMIVEHFAGWDGEYLPTATVTHAKSNCPLAGVQFDATEESVAAWNCRSPTEARGEPVAWRVKDYADGWMLAHTLDQAKGQAGNGNLIQPLYASHPPAREAVDDAREKVRAEIVRSAAILRPEELAVTVDAVLVAALQVKP